MARMCVGLRTLGRHKDVVRDGLHHMLWCATHTCRLTTYYEPSDLGNQLALCQPPVTVFAIEESQLLEQSSESMIEFPNRRT